MAIKLCFPTVGVVKSYLHKEIDFKKGMTAEYFDMCKKEIVRHVKIIIIFDIKIQQKILTKSVNPAGKGVE